MKLQRCCIVLSWHFEFDVLPDLQISKQKYKERFYHARKKIVNQPLHLQMEEPVSTPACKGLYHLWSKAIDVMFYGMSNIHLELKQSSTME